MEYTPVIKEIGEAAFTSAGFFWKAGWAFILGYAVSAMIQAFVPKSRLTQHMGDGKPSSIALATLFGSISSSCSFAALSAARALILKGAMFVEALAFMFASTNLVIELGVLIVIFLGWEFLAAEVIGGLLLIVISTSLFRLVAPDSWLEEARGRVEDEGGDVEDDFDWRERASSLSGWKIVGNRFVGEWKMVWEEILIGFSIAGIMAVFVPDSFWQTLFLVDAGGLPTWVVAIENAVVGPIVAMMTFIGSMGNIPLATVLSGSGVVFAGIMAFIYSDLVVPPLVAVNRKYYGSRVAFLIAGVMFVSIVATALCLAGAVAALGIEPSTQKVVEETTRFAVDYTFWLNMGLAVAGGVLIGLHLSSGPERGGSDWGFKRIVALSFGLFDAVGLGLHFFA